MACRHLAMRVIDQAFRDLAGSSGTNQESARVFLAGSSMLYHWCEVADVDPACLVTRAKQLMAAAIAAPDADCTSRHR